MKHVVRENRRVVILALIGLIGLFGLAPQCVAAASGPPCWRVLPQGELPADARLKPLRNLRDAYHPWSPSATTKDAWEREAEAIRTRLLVSNGLWPMPPKPPLEPKIFGKIDRDDYTIERVYFATHPGHYVTGNLYRPKSASGKIPGVLCPHGHWKNGRFYDAGESKAKDQIKKGAETFSSAAHYPLQARMVQLARMGCVVFHYDMVGNADSTQIAHRSGFTNVEAGLRLQNFMGLQTYNSIRALDFLLSLPDVDAGRIGVTGASGGGTQTFMLCAVDPRPTVAFPAVMVSTGMQGGCICENADFLRIGINNIAIAALCAPKPLAMSGADDWSIAIETKGLPELKQVYSLYGKTDLVHAKCYPHFKHNYNQVSRELMYDWFNRYLKLGLPTPVRERDFSPASPKELSVFDSDHARPKDATTAEELQSYFTKVANEQFHRLVPKDAAGLAEYRRIVGAAARVMFDSGEPGGGITEVAIAEETTLGGLSLAKGTATRAGADEQIPWVFLEPAEWNGTVVLWLDGRGKSCLFDKQGQPTAAVRKLTDAGMAVASGDVFLTGEFVQEGKGPVLPEIDERYHGYTFGYNRPVLSNRVQDILTIIGGLIDVAEARRVHLVGTGEAGPWALLARGLAGARVSRTMADLQGFGFNAVDDAKDPMFLPGALKYGGMGGLAALAAPADVIVAGAKGAAGQELEPLRAVYKAVGGRLVVSQEGLTEEAIVDELLR